MQLLYYRCTGIFFLLCKHVQEARVGACAHPRPAAWSDRWWECRPGVQPLACWLAAAIEPLPSGLLVLFTAASTHSCIACRASFVRGYDGHVSIQNKYTKAWTDVKCDLQVPGLLLLRDASGEVG